MPHRFVVMIAGECCTYDRFEDIPKDFDHVIEFSPEIPAGPHSDEQHAEIDAWGPKLEQLLEIEYARCSKSRG